MRKSRYFSTFLFLLLVPVGLMAQDDADLLRYAMLNPVGTARYNAMGGAFSALGANFTTLSTNPAGIGFYTRHEISLTGTVLYQTGTSDYYGKTNTVSKGNFAIPQGGGVFGVYNGTREKGKLWGLQLGFGANRLKDFNNNVYMKAVNPQSSYMEAVAAQSSGYDFAMQDNLADIGNLAYMTGLLDYTDTVNMFYGTFLGKGLQQKRILQESGNITEMTFSFGGNWSDMLYFGLTLGVPVVNYSSVSTIEESTVDGHMLEHGFRTYTLQQEKDVSGTGINLKLGLIYKPLPFFRVGVAFHTPTRYYLKERASAALDTKTMKYELSDNSTLPTYEKYNYTDRYNLVTPAKGILSLGFQIRNFGAVAIEGELIDYRLMRMDVSDNVDYNQYIKEIVRENYRLAGVVRIGTEWKVSILSFRAGYIWQSCPYKDKTLRDNWSNHTATAGIGFALGQRWNLDFGFMADLGKRTDDFYYLIDGATGDPLVKPAKLESFKYLYTLTLGFKF